MKLSEEAQAYEPQRIKNICELDSVPIDTEIEKETKTGKDNEEYTQFVTTIDGVKYRIPISVLGGIKGLMKKMPSVKQISVLKQGEGMETTYQVLPYIVEEKV